MKQMLCLTPYAKAHILVVVLALFCAGIVAVATTANAEILRRLLDQVLMVGHSDARQQALWMTVFLAVGVTLMKGIGVFWQQYAMAYVCQKITLALRVEYFRHLQTLPLSFFSRNRSGDLISRTSSDMTVLEQALRELIQIIAEPLILLCLIAYMFYLYWQLALLIFVILPALYFVVKSLSGHLRRTGLLLQNKAGDLSSILQESIQGIRIIKAFSLAQARNKVFEKEAEENFRYSMKAVKYTALASPATELADSIGIALMLFFGARGVIQGVITPGDLIGFLTSLGLMFHPIKKITNANSRIQQASGAIQRIFGILNEPKESDTGLLPPPQAGITIEFKQVHFQFEENRKALENLELLIKEGETLALAGPSGGGKTTFVNLLIRFFDVSEGQILLNGQDIRAYHLDSYRSLFGFVPQEVILFRGTILDNLRLSDPEVSREAIEEACKLAYAHEFIMNFPENYLTPIAELGVGLSGGQRQRLALARALIRKPRILILDEATSALDTESESYIQKSLADLHGQFTTIIIAHRLSTIQYADRIILLDQGRMAGSGTHQELLQTSQLYQRLCAHGGSL